MCDILCVNVSELRIVLLGPRGAGKSSSGNTILNQEEFDATQRTPQCVKRQGTVANRKVTVVDTPGWTASGPLEPSLLLSASLCPPGPHAYLLVVSVDATFSDDITKAIVQHAEVLGKEVWNQTVLLFTHGDRLGTGTSIEQHIANEGEALQWLVEKCGRRYHVLNNSNRDNEMQVTSLLEKIKMLGGEVMINTPEMMPPIVEVKTETRVLAPTVLHIENLKKIDLEEMIL